MDASYVKDSSTQHIISVEEVKEILHRLGLHPDFCILIDSMLFVGDVRDYDRFTYKYRFLNRLIDCKIQSRDLRRHKVYQLKKQSKGSFLS